MESNLKKFRNLKGFSQKELTQKTGISQNIISAVENEKLYCYPNWRKKLSKALDVPENELFPKYK